MNYKERLIKALKGEDVDKAPAVSVTQTAIVELMDIKNAEWPEAHSDPKLMAELAIAAHEFGNLEAVRYPYCLTVLAEALGCEVNMGTKNRQPSITDHPYKKGLDREDLPENLLESGRIPAVFEATNIIKEKVDESVPLIAGMEGPITLASDLCSVSKFMKWSIKKPEEFEKLLDFATEAAVKYANGLVENGADVICVADPVASPDLMNPKDFNERLKPRLTKFAEDVQSVTVLHVCGNVTPILDMMADCNFTALSIEEKVASVRDAKDVVGDRVSLVGNVSSPFSLLSGTPDKIKDDVTRALSEGIDVVAPGCGIAPNTPLENVKALVSGRDEYYQ
ncbi:methylcobamide:CoM methyltransferase MtaA [Methanosalsum natronophilum]|nr:methylcobamide:CoM methyltransferase MtaA [Methanosalsum natronophilum]MCS3923422.1 [methyl-Co(III) methanol-specific corrinoid protein]:coenzyme M methyltransferase [Methanosalsum natronophilum]